MTRQVRAMALVDLRRVVWPRWHTANVGAGGRPGRRRFGPERQAAGFDRSRCWGANNVTACYGR